MIRLLLSKFRVSLCHFIYPQFSVLSRKITFIMFFMQKAKIKIATLIIFQSNKFRNASKYFEKE